ncbi:MAG: sensor histidine kinase [Clostridia bacterium]|nr:sensor histidine kinase [Clostridia bacterium]
MKVDLYALVKNIKRFRFKSFFVRNLLITMLAILVPMTAIGIVFCTTVQNSADKEIGLIADSQLATVKKNVDMMIRTAEMFAIQTSFEQNVESFLYSSYGTSGNISKVQTNIRQNISSFINVHQYIHSVYVYSEKAGVVVHNNEITGIDSFKDQSWMLHYDSLPIVGDAVVARKYAGRYPGFISVIRSVGVEDAEKSGCVVVNIDVEKINEAIREDNKEQADVFLVDSHKTVYVSHNISLIGQQYTEFSELLANDDTQGDYSLSNYIYSETNSDLYDLLYISVMPNFYFRDMLQHTVFYMIMMMILLLLSVVIITLLISYRTYVPIQSLLDFLTPQELNDSQNMSNNEISYITENVKKSIEKSEKLEQELNYRLFLLNQAQLYALQTQINPHFLNNTLDVINWTAVSEMGMNNKVSKMLKSLSNLLHISLDGEHYLIPIEEELQHANIYTYIMSVNYGDDLNFIWDIDEEVHNCQMLKLTLQPILENAIEHGIKRKRGVGVIRIIGRTVNGDVQLTIQDNGVGMTEEELEILHRDLQDSKELTGQHIGIRNVNQRIKLVFGENYGLSVDSKKGEGTQVQVLIPKINL